jgi:hypothetical protein
MRPLGHLFEHYPVCSRHPWLLDCLISHLNTVSSGVINQGFVRKLLSCLIARRPPLWSSGQSSCVNTQRSGFHSRRYKVFGEVVGLERGLLSLASTIEELLGRKSSGSGLESRE